MAFDDLPQQTPFETAEANAYSVKTLEWSKSVSETSRCVLDVAYGKDYWQKIDIYLPESKEVKDLPVLMFAHGGGWTRGYKEMMGFMAPPITSLPAIFISVSYRLAPCDQFENNELRGEDTRFPVPMNDYLSAVQWVYQNIENFGGDHNRIFIGGHSAGGHLSSLVALRKDLIESLNLPRNVIKACFPVSSTFNFCGTSSEPGISVEHIRRILLRRDEDASVASPITHVGDNDTPFFITYGSRDIERVKLTSQEMISALQKQPHFIGYYIFEGLDHFDMNLAQGDENNHWVITVKSWMIEH